MGAAVALHVALRYPDVVRKLVLASVTYTLSGIHPGLMDGLGEMQPEMMHGSTWHEEYLRLWGTWSYNGIEAWRTLVVEWFGSLGSERVVVELDRVHTRVTNDLAVANAFISYTGVSAESKALRTMHNRLTWALKQHGTAWKIVHEHSSAPVDPETSKVLLQR